MDVRKIFVGESLIIVGLFCFRFVQGLVPMYFLLMTVFTIGEVFNTIGSQPFMTRRIPSTHWGRMNSLINIFTGGFSAVGEIFMGRVIDTSGYESGWNLVGILGVVTIALLVLINITDRKQFHLLYEENQNEL
jgi:predicted MFS family arabinose efflux permease